MRRPAVALALVLGALLGVGVAACQRRAAVDADEAWTVRAFGSYNYVRTLRHNATGACFVAYRDGGLAPAAPEVCR